MGLETLALVYLVDFFSNLLVIPLLVIWAPFPLWVIEFGIWLHWVIFWTKEAYNESKWVESDDHFGPYYNIDVNTHGEADVKEAAEYAYVELGVGGRGQTSSE